MIDGHNLIGKLPDVQLSDPDDEQALIERLRRFCREHQVKAVVYFDRGEPMGRNPPTQGGLTVHFVRGGLDADSALIGHLTRLGGAARNWTVISSDLQIKRAAGQAGARWISSESFVLDWLSEPPEAPPPEKPDGVPPEALDSWLDLFGEGGMED